MNQKRFWRNATFVCLVEATLNIGAAFAQTQGSIPVYGVGGSLGDSVMYQCGVDQLSLCVNQPNPLGSKMAITSESFISILGIADAPAGDNTGVWGQTDSNGNRTAGVFGLATSLSGSTTGVWGRTVSSSDGSTGVYGEVQATNGATYGVLGRSSSSSIGSAGVFGVVSDGTSNSGVRGVSTALNGNGIIGEANNGSTAYAIWGRSTTGYAGAFDGRVKVNGTLSAGAVQITGADFSEKFEVRRGDAAVRPGMVVAIDSANPGKLAVSSKAYDRRVAGVLSGAGGIATGMLMGQPGTLADGDQAVALSGRVYVWADASLEPIAAGDLLTTSDTPGHAMRVKDHGKAQGAILGKAMTGLERGRGLVLLLVTLQ